MPATSKVDFNKFSEVAIQYNLRDENLNSIKGPSDQCWLNISKDLNYSISAKYAYIIVKENRNEVRKKIFPNEVPTNAEECEQKEKCDSQSFCSSESSEGILMNDNALNFNITLSADEWGSLYDNKPQVYKRSDKKSEYRLYYTLHPHKWTSVIHTHFYEQTKLPCSIVYKYAKIYQEGEIFLKISGHCSSCNSTLIGVLTDSTTIGSRVIIRCTIQGKFKSCRSHRKRRVNGDNKEQYLNRLQIQNQSASFIQRTEAKSIMNYGDLVPSHIPSLNALRLMKHKILKNDRVHENPLVSVSILKGIPPYNNIIKDIGNDRFYLHYWTTSEVNNYRIYAKQTTVPTISIDATGSVVKKMILFSGRETHNIFLYEICVYDEKSKNQFSVAHMLSEKHGNNSISYWLTEWLCDVKSPPLVVVTDQSLALMHAVAKSFTQFSDLNAYILNCSKLIKKEIGSEIPKCMIRNDFNHVMHLVSTWPEFKISTHRIKNFYMRAVGLIVVNTSIDDIKIILKSIFTTALHEFDGVNDNLEPTTCENAKQYLKRRIATHIIEIDFDDQQSDMLHYEEETDHDSFPVSTPSIFQDIKCIYNQCVEISLLACNSTGDHDKMQYSPSLAKRLLNFCKYITCWSAVMVPIFGYGNLTESSAPSESMFKDLKSVVFKHKLLPLRLDDFFITHVDSIIGSMNLIKTAVQAKEDISDIHINPKQNISNTQEIYKQMISNIQDEPQKVIIDFTEDWMGLGNPKNKNKKSKYITKDPTILHLNDNSRAKGSCIGVLRNGSVSELQSININNEYVSLTNTCAFDSISQVMFCAYADSTNYRQFVENNVQQNIFMELVSHVLGDGINIQSYRRRALFLKNVFSKDTYKYCNGITVINAACTAQFMMSKVFEGIPSIIEQKKCNSCLNSVTRQQFHALANLPTDDLRFLPDVLENYGMDQVYCEHCGFLLERIVEFKEHLIIEPAVPITKKRKAANNLDLDIKLKEVNRTMKIRGNIFYLRGLICFIPPVSNVQNSIGHYIAYCYRESTNEWEKYDDLATKPKNVRPTTEILHCQFLVYTI